MASGFNTPVFLAAVLCLVALAPPPTRAIDEIQVYNASIA
jgi:hypothetical protein